MGSSRTWLLAVAVAALIQPRESIAAEIDISGRWQITADCGNGPNILTLDLSEDVATGSVTAHEVACGTIAVPGGIVQPVSCAIIPSTITGLVSGTTFTLPDSGLVVRSFDFDPPESGIPPCTEVMTVSSEFRLVATIADAGDRIGDTLSGTAFLGESRLFDALGVNCDTLPAGGTCSLNGLRETVQLSNGTGEGTVRLTVNVVGAFGVHVIGELDGSYDPVGPTDPATTVFESDLYSSPLGAFLGGAGSSPLGAFLGGSSTAGAFLGIAPGLFDTEFIESTEMKARSRFSFREFDVLLSQSLPPPTGGGSVLTQTYRITNNGEAPANFTLVRHLDGDLYFDGTLLDFGGASSDGKTVFEFDSGDDPRNATTFVGIRNLPGGGTQVGYTVQPYRYTGAVVAAGGIPPEDLNRIFGDDNGDRLTDFAYDVTLSLANRLTIAPGQTGAFVTLTIFGGGVPTEVLNCDDGVDNDGDGLIDCEDPDCICECTANEDCDDGNVCTDDACDPDSRTCSWLPNSAPCDDGNACTQTDTCQAGTCTGGNPIVCTASDSCHDDATCDPATGICSDPAKPDGAVCNDDDLCTQTDTCQAGSCIGTNPVICPASGQCHDAGVCDPSTGVCSFPAKPDETACDDGNACTLGDVCSAGSCEPGTPNSCDDANPCTDDACNPGSGACSNPPNSAPCNDGSLCTRSDSCLAGVCVGADPIVCTPLGQCHDAGVCDRSTGVCSDPMKPDGAICSDGTLCTQTDTCQAGTCIGTNPVTCPASDQCHDAGVCDPETGQCSQPEKPNGTACDDGNACTLGDVCSAGSCRPGTPKSCDDANPCTDDACDPGSGACSNLPNSAPCDDGNPCTRSDTCLAGVCVGADPIVCTALDQCHDVGVCAPATGQCSHPEKPNGTACDDGNACTLGDVCSAGSCGPGTPKSCDDGNPCTDDACDPGSGACSNPANSAPCDDGNLCTVNDTCAGGSCRPGAARICPPDTNGCTDAACDPASGCTQRPSPDGTRCKTAVGCVRGTCAAGACEPSSECFCDDAADCADDGDVCNGSETCTAGECVLGLPLACPADDNPCTAAACDPVTGCGQAPAPDGTRCETPGGCTAGTCAGGTCTLGASCPCTVDAECADGNVCNGAETCNVGIGTCQVGPPLQCTQDANTCTAEVCDPAAGGCVSQATGDGNDCNVEKASGCVTGSCAAGTCVEDPDCNVVFTVAQDVVEIAPDAKSVTITTTCSGEKGDTCTAQGFFESLPEAAAEAGASLTASAAAAKKKKKNKCAQRTQNVTTDTAITKPANRKIKTSGQATLKLKLNPIGKCLLGQIGSAGLTVRVSGSVTPKGGSEPKLLDILVRVVRRQ